MESDLSRILVVDDNPQTVKLLSSWFTQTGYAFDIAYDGEQAYQQLLAHPAGYYSAIVSDRLMPNMDGLTFLKKVKAHPQHRYTPVILQTALGDSASIHEGLMAGAFYYLAKPFDLKVVDSVIQAAIKEAKIHQELRHQVATFKDSLTLLDSVTFKYRTLCEAKKLAILIANMTHNPNQNVVGLYELMVNAVEHGNLGITYEEKTQLINQQVFMQEVEQRLNAPEYKDKWVCVAVKNYDAYLDVKITDMGQGFDFENYLEFSEKRLMDNHGRGIMMANNVGFLKLLYSECGKTVLCQIPK